MHHNKGKFIVIEGSDGSGKATQTEILYSRLKEAGFIVEKISFPQYGKPSCGAVEEYLKGSYGTAEDVGPYRASLFYAIDRYDASFKIKNWLAEGKIVISDRYVISNIAHQGGKIPDTPTRKLFFSWIEKLEYGVFKIPRPDLNLILLTDPRVSESLIRLRNNSSDGEEIKRDIHEEDSSHLSKAFSIYLEISEHFNDIATLNCLSQGIMREKVSINNEIIELLKKNDIIPSSLFIPYGY